MKRFFIFFILFSFIGCLSYIAYTTPEEYITTNVYDGYVKDNYYCSKHSTRFVDTKTNKTIVLDHSAYYTGKYKVKKGDHLKVVETVTKKIDYNRTYKVYYNGKLISNYYNVRIYRIY